MPNREPEIRDLKEAHRKSAEKVRTLLAELEAAEREFARLTDRVKALTESPAAWKEFLSISTGSRMP